VTFFMNAGKKCLYNTHPEKYKIQIQKIQINILIRIYIILEKFNSLLQQQQLQFTDNSSIIVTN